MFRDPLGRWGEMFRAKVLAMQAAVGATVQSVKDVATDAKDIASGVFVEAASRHPLVVAAKGLIELYHGADTAIETGDLKPLVRATPPGKVVQGVMDLSALAKKEGAGGVAKKLLPISQLRPEISKAQQAWAAGDLHTAARHGTKAAQAVGDTILLLYGGARAAPALAAKGEKLLEKAAKALSAEAPEAATAGAAMDTAAASVAPEVAAEAEASASLSTGGGAGKLAKPPTAGAPAEVQQATPPVAAESGVRLTGGGQRILRDPALQAIKDSSVADAIRARGGGAGQVNQIATDLRGKPLGEVANMAAQGSEEARTAIKLVKQASAKAQKYGGKQ